VSGRFPLLSVLDETWTRRQQHYRQLRRHGIKAELQVPPQAANLRFCLSRTDGQLECRVGANDWAIRQLPGIAGLDWSRLDSRQLAGLCNVERPLQFPSAGLEYQHARFLGLAENDLCAVPSPCVESREGKVWIDHLEGCWGTPAASSVELPAALSLPVIFRIGRLALPLRRVRRLRAGDIVLVPFHRTQAWLGPRCLFEFEIQQEAIIVNALYETEDDQLDSEFTHRGEARLESIELASLPIALDITLCQLSLSLAELAELRVGSVLNLPEQAYRRVKLQHQGHTLATGELVQIGDTLGVQINTSLSLKTT
jgi:type III secretion protein Q